MLVTLSAARAGTAADATPPPPLRSVAVEVAALYGRTLGAASECPEIGADRLKAVTEKVLAHLRDLAPDRDERELVGQRFSGAIDEGAQAVRNGETICAQAADDLGNLDYELTQAGARKP